MGQSFIKDPEAELDYTISWADWLAVGETISTSTWAAETGITIESVPAPSSTVTTATVWLTGGTAGAAYRLTNTIVTSAGRTDQRTITLKVAER